MALTREQLFEQMFPGLAGVHRQQQENLTRGVAPSGVRPLPAPFPEEAGTDRLRRLALAGVVRPVAEIGAAVADIPAMVGVPVFGERGEFSGRTQDWVERLREEGQLRGTTGEAIAGFLGTAASYAIPYAGAKAAIARGLAGTAKAAQAVRLPRAAAKLTRAADATRLPKNIKQYMLREGAIAVPLYAATEAPRHGEGQADTPAELAQFIALSMAGGAIEGGASKLAQLARARRAASAPGAVEDAIDSTTEALRAGTTTPQTRPATPQPQAGELISNPVYIAAMQQVYDASDVARQASNEAARSKAAVVQAYADITRYEQMVAAGDTNAPSLSTINTHKQAAEALVQKARAAEKRALDAVALVTQKTTEAARLAQIIAPINVQPQAATPTIVPAVLPEQRANTLRHAYILRTDQDMITMRPATTAGDAKVAERAAIVKRNARQASLEYSRAIEVLENPQASPVDVANATKVIEDKWQSVTANKRSKARLERVAAMYDASGIKHTPIVGQQPVAPQAAAQRPVAGKKYTVPRPGAAATAPTAAPSGVFADDFAVDVVDDIGAASTPFVSAPATPAVPVAPAATAGAVTAPKKLTKKPTTLFPSKPLVITANETRHPPSELTWNQLTLHTLPHKNELVKLTPDDITQSLMDEMEEKANQLANIYNSTGDTIVAGHLRAVANSIRDYNSAYLDDLTKVYNLSDKAFHKEYTVPARIAYNKFKKQSGVDAGKATLAVDAGGYVGTSTLADIPAVETTAELTKNDLTSANLERLKKKAKRVAEIYKEANEMRVYNDLRAIAKEIETSKAPSLARLTYLDSLDVDKAHKDFVKDRREAVLAKLRQDLNIPDKVPVYPDFIPASPYAGTVVTPGVRVVGGATPAGATPASATASAVKQPVGGTTAISAAEIPKADVGILTETAITRDVLTALKKKANGIADVYKAAGDMQVYADIKRVADAIRDAKKNKVSIADALKLPGHTLDDLQRINQLAPKSEHYTKLNAQIANNKAALAAQPQGGGTPQATVDTVPLATTTAGTVSPATDTVGTAGTTATGSSPFKLDPPTAVSDADRIATLTGERKAGLERALVAYQTRARPMDIPTLIAKAQAYVQKLYDLKPRKDGVNAWRLLEEQRLPAIIKALQDGTYTDDMIIELTELPEPGAFHDSGGTARINTISDALAAGAYARARRGAAQIPITTAQTTYQPMSTVGEQLQTKVGDRPTTTPAGAGHAPESLFEALLQREIRLPINTNATTLTAADITTPFLQGLFNKIDAIHKVYYEAGHTAAANKLSQSLEALRKVKDGHPAHVFKHKKTSLNELQKLHDLADVNLHRKYVRAQSQQTDVVGGGTAAQTPDPPAPRTDAEPVSPPVEGGVIAQGTPSPPQAEVQSNIMPMSRLVDEATGVPVAETPLPAIVLSDTDRTNYVASVTALENHWKGELDVLQNSDEYLRQVNAAGRQAVAGQNLPTDVARDTAIRAENVVRTELQRPIYERLAALRTMKTALNNNNATASTLTGIDSMLQKVTATQGAEYVDGLIAQARPHVLTDTPPGAGLHKKPPLTPEEQNLSHALWRMHEVLTFQDNVPVFTAKLNESVTAVKALLRGSTNAELRMYADKQTNNQTNYIKGLTDLLENMKNPPEKIMDAHEVVLQRYNLLRGAVGLVQEKDAHYKSLLDAVKATGARVRKQDETPAKLVALADGLLQGKTKLPQAGVWTRTRDDFVEAMKKHNKKDALEDVARFKAEHKRGTLWKLQDEIDKYNEVQLDRRYWKEYAEEVENLYELNNKRKPIAELVADTPPTTGKPLSKKGKAAAAQEAKDYDEVVAMYERGETVPPTTRAWDILRKHFKDNPDELAELNAEEAMYWEMTANELMHTARERGQKHIFVEDILDMQDVPVVEQAGTTPLYHVFLRNAVATMRKHVENHGFKFVDAFEEIAEDLKFKKGKQVNQATVQAYINENFDGRVNLKTIATRARNRLGMSIVGNDGVPLAMFPGAVPTKQFQAIIDRFSRLKRHPKTKPTFEPIQRVSPANPSVPEDLLVLLPTKLRSTLRALDDDASSINAQVERLITNHGRYDIMSPEAKAMLSDFAEQLDKVAVKRDALQAEVDTAIGGVAKGEYAKSASMAVQRDKLTDDPFVVFGGEEGTPMRVWTAPLSLRKVYTYDTAPLTTYDAKVLRSNPGMYGAWLSQMEDAFGETIVRMYRDPMRKLKIFRQDFEDALFALTKPIQNRPEALARVTELLEGNSPVAATDLERRIAVGMRAWYDRLFQEFDIDPERFLKDYAPRIRQFGGDVRRAFPDATEDELRGLYFFAKDTRVLDGEALPYPTETNALTVAMTYLRRGSAQKFIEPVIKATKHIHDGMDKDRARMYTAWVDGMLNRPLAEESLINGWVDNALRTFGVRLGKDKHNLTREFSSLTSWLIYQSTLGLNPMTVLKQLTQSMLSVATLDANPAVGLKYFYKAARAMKSAKGKDWLQYNTVIQDRAFYEGAEMQAQLLRRIQKPIEDVTLRAFRWGDTVNVNLAFMMKALKEADAGKPLSTVFDEANVFAGHTQFKYGPEDSARFFRGPTGKFFGILMSYPLHFASFLHRHWREPGHEGKRKVLNTIAGLYALQWGLSEITGMDFSSTSPHETASGWLPLTWLMGAETASIPVDTVLRAKDMFNSYLGGTPADQQEAWSNMRGALLHYVPLSTQGRRVLRAINVSADGGYVMDEQAGIPYQVRTKMEPWEIARSIVGPTVESRALRGEFADARTTEQMYNYMRDKVIEAYMNNDRETVRHYQDEIARRGGNPVTRADIERRQEQGQMTAIERMRQGLPEGYTPPDPTAGQWLLRNILNQPTY